MHCKVLFIGVVFLIYVTDKENKEKTATVEASPTVESVMDLLYDMSSRWKEIAGALGFNEDMIDEIDTNNEMDEACLHDCVERWVTRMRPSREQLSLIPTDLKNNGEPEREGQGRPGSRPGSSARDKENKEKTATVEATVTHSPQVE